MAANAFSVSYDLTRISANKQPDPSDLPGVSLELVQALERIFPDRCAVLGDTIEKIMFDAGCAKVVRKIRAEYHDFFR